MATKTVGTPLTTSLTAVQYSPDPNKTSNADFATVAQGIWRDRTQSAAGPFGGGNPHDDGGRVGSILAGAFVRGGLLYLPGRERMPIVINPGDWICVDGFGNVFLIPQRALPTTLTGSVTLVSGSNVVTSATDIRTYGWQMGTHVTSSHTPASSVINTIAPGGLSFTITDTSGVAANATGSATETMTGGTFTHS